MVSPLERFQSLLRELFQFDCQDLDFGIYRVLNFKRREIEAFITERLPAIVDEAFTRYVEQDKMAIERELAGKRHELEETARKLGQQAFDADGQLSLVLRETPLGREFTELEQKARTTEVSRELKESVFNDLYAFFSRYYDDGDIFSKPRRGKVEIPFTGHEDVVLHWANKDQYYIKTGEHFKTYRFTLSAEKATVAFALKNASTEANNNRGEKRYFVLAAKDPATFDDASRTLTVFFEYRPLTAGEKEGYGKTENQKPQDKLNAEAEQSILRRVKDPAIKARLAQSTAEGRPSLLLHHLTRFTRRNTSDFFIHKNLRGFLERELDDFLKTEVLRVDELLAPGGDVAARQLARARVVRDIALRLIAFLAQIEDFQKKLFEKRKFVVRTEYCVTLDRLPESLWDDVLKNEAQLAEWRELYAITKKKPDKAFLKEHDKLVVDTRHFPESFKWQLLASFDDLDATLDGLLIKSENFQALALLLAKYRERVKCIYIDPPYNTGSDEFIYRDGYQRSCWATMMIDRLALSCACLPSEGAILASIDDNEAENLIALMGIAFGRNNHVANICQKSRHSVSNDLIISSNHNFQILYAKDWAELFRRRSRFRLPNELTGFENPDHDPKGPWKLMPVDGPGGGAKANPYYTFRGVSGFFRYSKETMQKLYEAGEIVVRGKSISRKYYLSYAKERGASTTTWWDDVGTTTEGTNTLISLFGDKVFNNPKPLGLIERYALLACGDGDWLLDFFGGSGTTAHAVINLNRTGKGKRKFILVESGGWFDAVLLPRVKKASFCEEWKDGKPVGCKGVSHLLKYQVLEQYEDTLNNLELPRAREGELALKEFGDDYLLRYMLEFETAGSASLLAVEQLRHPFDYQLKVQEGDEIVERTVDLIETFNYLLGLHVKKLREFRAGTEGNAQRRRSSNGVAKPANGSRLYRAVLGEDRQGRSVVVIWRDTDGLENNPEALKHDREFIEKTILPVLLGRNGRPDRLLVNQPFTGQADAIEPEFHRLMFAPLG